MITYNFFKVHSLSKIELVDKNVKKQDLGVVNICPKAGLGSISPAEPPLQTPLELVGGPVIPHSRTFELQNDLGEFPWVANGNLLEFSFGPEGVQIRPVVIQPPEQSKFPAAPELRGPRLPCLSN